MRGLGFEFNKKINYVQNALPYLGKIIIFLIFGIKLMEIVILDLSYKFFKDLVHSMTQIKGLISRLQFFRG